MDLKTRQKLKAIAKGMPGQKGVTGPVAGRRKPGKPCGKTFISADYLCSKGKLLEAAKRLRGSEEGRKYAEKVRAFKGLEKLKGKSEKVAPKDPQELANEAYAKKWGKSWDGAPADLKKAIERTGKPKEITEDGAKAYKTTTAFHIDGGIHMAKYQPGEGRADAVWRHEYGHFLDFRMQDGERAKAGPEIKRLQDEEEKLWSDYKNRGAMIKSKMQEFDNIKDKSRRQMELGAFFTSKEYLDYQESERTFNAQINDVRERKAKLRPAQYRSAKPDALAAMDKDAKALKSAKSKAVAKEKKDMKKGLEDAYDLATGTYRWKGLRDAGMDMNLAENISDMGSTAPGPTELLKRVYPGKAGKTMMEQAAERRLAKSIEQEGRAKGGIYNHREAVKAHVDKQIKSLPPIYKTAWDRIQKESPDILESGFRLEKTAYRLTSGNPDHLIALIEDTTGVPGQYGREPKGMLYDLTGSATKNSVGFGHSNSYYYNRDRQSVEVFANVVSLWGSGDPLEMAAAEYFTPSYTKIVKQAIKEM